MKNYNKMHNQESNDSANSETTAGLVQSETTETTSDENKKLVIVDNCNKLNVRKFPDIESSVKGIVNKGDTLVAVNEIEGWVNVITKTGTEGFVMREFVTDLIPEV